MRIEKHFDVSCPPEDAARAVADDDALLGLFSEARSEIVERDGNLRVIRSHYTALGRQGVATFHFVFHPGGDVEFEKVCDGRVWRSLRGRVCFEPRGAGARVQLEMEGRTKPLVPEMAIRGPLREQVEEMARALRRRIEG